MEKDKTTTETVTSFPYGSIRLILPLESKMYVDFKLDGQDKIDWSFMMMDRQLVIDIRDSLKSGLQETDRIHKNACQNIGEPNNAEILQKLSEKKQRLQMMLTLIEKELDPNA